MYGYGDFIGSAYYNTASLRSHFKNFQTSTMSNGLLLRTTKASRTRETLLRFRAVPIRHQSGKKFLVPDSFQPHLKYKFGRRRRSPKDINDGWTQQQPGSSRSSNIEIGEPDSNEAQQALDNSLELALEQASRQALGLSTESVIDGFCGQTHHPHVSSFMRAYLSVNYINTNAVRQFWDAFLNHLPLDPLNNAYITTPRGKLAHNAYTWASSRDGPLYSRNIANMGWHLFFFTTPILGQRLLFDGTDARFLPGPSAVWRYRLWAGGSINLYRMFGKPIYENFAQHQLERPVDLRIVGANQTPEKLFVTVSKRFYQMAGKLKPAEQTVPGILKYLKKDPEYNSVGIQTGGPYLEEKYTLCFLREPPNLGGKGVATKVIAPPIQPKFSHTLTPDRHLLFCWSALSYNAHLIHLDKSFAQKEYGAKDLVVHGPLTLMLILEWFQREITRYAIERQLSRFHLKSIEYKNLAPLFVDEPMTLCTKPSKFPTPGTLADSWEVWVQKDLGDGLKSMAFKGTIKLNVEVDPKIKDTHNYKRLQSSNIPKADTPVNQDNQGNRFKSPFF